MTPAQREFHRMLKKTRDEMNAKFQKDEDGKYTGDYYYGIKNNKLEKIIIKEAPSSN